MAKKRSSSKDKSVKLSEEFLMSWTVNMAGRRSFYVRDTEVRCLLANYSRKGKHSFGYDYRKDKVHKTRVFGYFPHMTVEEARVRATEIHKECIEGGKNYDELFEIHRLPRYVYFVMNGKGEIKIGRSTDVWNRIHGLVSEQTNMYLLGLREETKRVNETALHYLYRAYRVNGEFFEGNAYILELISRFCTYRDTDLEVARLMGQQENEIY